MGEGIFWEENLVEIRYGVSRVSQKNMKIHKVDLRRLFRVSYDPISQCMAKLN